MAIDYTIDYDCIPKQQLTTEGIRERLKGAERAALIINQYREAGDMRPPSEMGYEFTRRTPEGAEETRIIVVQDVLNDAADLEPLTPHCVGCPANRTGNPFGCMGYVGYPISEAGEAWLLDRLPVPDEALVWLLLKQGVDNFQYDGQQIAFLRQNNDAYFEARRAAERRLGEFSLNANQVFEMFFTVGDIIPNHAGILLLFFRAIDRDIEADAIIHLTPAGPDVADRHPFIIQSEPYDDVTIRDLKGFLEALYIAWALNVNLLVDA
ncbi:hypothetical protein G4Y79_08265 [Phototrophicus methaneseepsis]|uniref:Uncharacterized protein n=1 Tax=Phototrophicus methaneseepsis TaxID=2710758 RepID=A0A7S8ECC1_9CHLR|nr:hypothetical protein [Phototrophicus methaneseepsis]QPC84355.1 hypothetical protein G4Y79_08265 [Phototrophicus methaneseepsis]